MDSGSVQLKIQEPLQSLQFLLQQNRYNCFMLQCYESYFLHLIKAYFLLGRNRTSEEVPYAKLQRGFFGFIFFDSFAFFTKCLHCITK